MKRSGSTTVVWGLYDHLYDGYLTQVVERLDVASSEFLRAACRQSADNLATVVQIG